MLRISQSPEPLFTMPARKRGKMKIVLAKINDIFEILDLQKLSYKQEAEIYNDYEIPPLTQTIEGIKNEFNNSTVLKAVIDDIIVGSVRAYIKNHKCYIDVILED